MVSHELAYKHDEHPPKQSVSLTLSFLCIYSHHDPRSREGHSTERKEFLAFDRIVRCVAAVFRCNFEVLTSLPNEAHQITRRVKRNARSVVRRGPPERRGLRSVPPWNSCCPWGHFHEVWNVVVAPLHFSLVKKPIRKLSPNVILCA